MATLIINRTLGYVVGVAVACVFAWHLYFVIMHFRPPFQYISITAEPNEIKSTAPLRLVYRYNRARVCWTSLTRIIIRIDSGEVAHRSSVSGGASRPRQGNVVVNFIGDHGLTAGNYVMRTIVFSECLDGNHTTLGPDAHFSIVD